MNDRAEPAQPVFSAADIGALAHLYRGEVYRSTVWRTRLDATTNWAVVATGIALSVTFSSARRMTAHPVPISRCSSRDAVARQPGPAEASPANEVPSATVHFVGTFAGDPDATEVDVDLGA